MTQDHEARFTCKASASNLPGQLTFKLTSHHADLLDELVTSGLVEIEPLKEKWIDSNDRLENVQNSGWKTTRSLILKPETAIHDIHVEVTYLPTLCRQLIAFFDTFMVVGTP